MSTKLPGWLVPAVLLAAVSGAVLFGAEAGWLAPRPAVHNITIQASQFAFAPATIQVRQGERVRVQVVAKDLAHGFYLDSYGVEAAAAPGAPATVEFVADRAGSYRYRCAVTCGPLHPFMSGELEVLPASTLNPGPFLAVAMLTIVVAVVAVVFIWRTPSREVTHA